MAFGQRQRDRPILGGAGTKQGESVTQKVKSPLRLGFVVDFIDVQFGSWHYPTFNVADMSIVIGAGLLIIDMFLAKRKEAATAKE